MSCLHNISYRLAVLVILVVVTPVVPVNTKQSETAAPEISSNKYKVLIIVPLTTTSEKGAYIPIANGLGERGHEVTIVSKTKSTYTTKNVEEIVVPQPDMFMGNPLNIRKESSKILVQMDFSWNVGLCEAVYENPDFLNVVQNKQFDLVITNTFFHQCFVGVAAKQGAHLIYLSTMPLVSYFQELTGARNPTSFVSHPFASSSDDMNFSERFFNTVFDHYWTLFLTWSYGPAMENVYRKYLGQDLPSARDIEGNVSLIFSNTHVTTAPPRPMLPDVVEVGGMHCRPAKPLPKDLEDFISEAKDGFIYFSLGSFIRGQDMPDEWRVMFVNVFSRLKQRVLWKWETEEMDYLPANIKLGKWLPQQDILGHPKLRLFITHGGAFSTQEAIYHGVPFLGMPIFGDQNLNMQHAQRQGVAIMLEMLEMTEELIENSVQELLNNKTYGQNAKRVSAIFRDQPETPVERAVFWTEYVLKHKGAHHLRSASRKLTFLQYHSLDVLGTIILALLIIAFIVIALITITICAIIKRASRSKPTGLAPVKKSQ